MTTASDTGPDHAAGRPVGVVVLVAAVLLFPVVFSNPATTSIAVFTVLYMAAASAWNTFSGFSGYISFGHTVFFGVGAYTLALVTEHWRGSFWELALVPVGGLAAAAVAIPYGAITLRTRRLVFIIVTIAVFFIFQLFAYNLSFTNGTAGVTVPTPNTGAAAFNDVVYYVGASVLAIVVALSWAVRRSRFGLQLLAIRDDEVRAAGLGVNTGKLKLVAFCLSAFGVGMVGSIYAFFLGSIYPDSAFTPVFDLSMLLMAILGGLGTVAGPLLGALILEPLSQYLTLAFPNDNLYLTLYGALLVVAIIILPRGLIPTIGGAMRRRGERLRERAIREPVPPEAKGSLDGRGMTS